MAQIPSSRSARPIALGLLLVLSGTALAATVAAAPGSPSAGSAAAAVDDAPRPATPANGRGSITNGTFFRSACALSHVASDDPIVHPGMPGGSHSHNFFGNSTTDADSTLETLVGQPTTCSLAGDTAAYWVPALYWRGTAVAPRFAFAYYLADGARGRIAPFPAGLKVIAGTASATTPQPTSIVGWKCGNTGGPLSPEPLACPGSTSVLVHNFPDCWDGVNLDSADHKSHLAYRVRGRCPSTHPVAVPQLSLRVHYRLPAVTELTLAPGSIYGAHADFFNAWDQDTLTRLIDVNLNNPRR